MSVGAAKKGEGKLQSRERRGGELGGERKHRVYLGQKGRGGTILLQIWNELVITPTGGGDWFRRGDCRGKNAKPAVLEGKKRACGGRSKKASKKPAGNQTLAPFRTSRAKVRISTPGEEKRGNSNSG